VTGRHVGPLHHASANISIIHERECLGNTRRCSVPISEE
jgi:hypothetical protein